LTCLTSPWLAATGVATGGEEADGEAIIAAATQRLRQREPFSLDGLLNATERGYIEAALKLAHGNVSQAARLLGIHRTTLYNRMESSAREL
jgi:DNA-binding NtrC family response regulator